MDFSIFHVFQSVVVIIAIDVQIVSFWLKGFPSCCLLSLFKRILIVFWCLPCPGLRICSLSSSKEAIFLLDIFKYVLLLPGLLLTKVLFPLASLAKLFSCFLSLSTDCKKKILLLEIKILFLWYSVLLIRQSSRLWKFTWVNIGKNLVIIMAGAGRFQQLVIFI